MSMSPDRFPIVQRLPTRAIQFAATAPKDTWPEGVVEYKPRNYELHDRGRRHPLVDGDWIVYDRGVLSTMPDSEFRQVFNAPTVPAARKRR
jgi:hypothetical protein